MITCLRLFRPLLPGRFCPGVLACLLAVCLGAAWPCPAPAGQAPGQKDSRVIVNGIDAPRSIFPHKKPILPAPEDILEAMLGIPYRADGAVDERGKFTLFADQGASFDDPGTNCSGFVVAACRFILKRNFTLAEVKKDRLNDSGPNAKLGQDWDFGWDLIMNISEGLPRKAILPDAVEADPASGNGLTMRGFDIQDPATWKELPQRLKPKRLYLISFNTQTSRKGYKIIHYHVGLIYVTAAGRACFYHNTGQAKRSNRRDLNAPRGRESFKRAFANNKNYRKMMFIIEVGQDTQE